jgi:pimeloyl-ACP methyl ester carboxylesterase
VGGFVSDLLNLLDERGIERAGIAAHSFGSLLVQHLASAHPDRVAQLALVGPIKAPGEAGRAGARDRAAKVRREGMGAVADGIVNVATAAATSERKPVAAAFVRELLLRQDPEGYAQTCEALADATDPQLNRISAPTLLLTGAQDAVGTPATAEKLSHELANANVVIIEDCGHWTAIEAPEATLRALDDFFQ